MSWAGCQKNLIDVNFHLQKSLKIFEKKSADKIWSKKDKGIKVSPPVPNRVKTLDICPIFPIFETSCWLLYFSSNFLKLESQTYFRKSNEIVSKFSSLKLRTLAQCTHAYNSKHLAVNGAIFQGIGTNLDKWMNLKRFCTLL